MKSETEILLQIEEQSTALSQALAMAEQAYSDLTSGVERKLNKSLGDLRDANRRRIARIREEHRASTDRELKQLLGVQRQSGAWTAPWDSPAFASFRPAAAPPMVARFGELTFRGPYTEVKTPALLPFTGGRNLVIRATGSAKDSAASAIEALILRLLLTTPPAKLKLLLIDPVGLGQNVASLLTLGDYDEELVTGKAWVERQHIEQRLVDISDHMETVIQKYLRKRFDSMEAYNAEAGEVAEPYRLVAAINFPVNFTEQAARRLVSIARNGPRCGVLTLVTVDEGQSPPRGFAYDDLQRDAVVITHQNGRFVWNDPLFQQGELELDRPPEAERLESLIRELGEETTTASRVEVPFERLAPPRDSWWSFSTEEGIKIPIGRAGARQTQFLELGEDAVHALVVGQTGSGKTNLMHVIITGLAMHFPVDELELYLIDFKEGVGFKHYAPGNGDIGVLPHARVIAIESEREFGLSCLEALDREIGVRGDLFREAGCDKLAEYRSSQKVSMPRILMVADEFHRFFAEDDALARRARQLLHRIVTEGRAFGIHLILGTQTLGGATTLPRETRDQMAVRIALRCSEADSRLILAEDNPAARLLSRPGEAIYNSGMGLVERNSLFQVAWLDDGSRGELLSQVAEGAVRRPGQPPIVFEGNVPARLQENEILQQHLGTGLWSPRSPIVATWLGRSVAIKEPTTALFASRAGRNLLVVGRDEEQAVSICAAAVIGLAAQLGPEDLEIDLIALPSVDSTWAGFSAELSSALPHRCSEINRRGLVPRLGELAALVDQRAAEERFSGPLVLVVGLGLQRARQLREQETSYRVGEAGQGKSPSPHRQLAKLLAEGPEVGVHVVGWWDSLASLGRAVDRRTREEFGVRVALPMSQDESNQLLDSPAASKLGRLRALLWDEDRPGQAEKFIPYSLRAGVWSATLAEALKSKRPAP